MKLLISVFLFICLSLSNESFANISQIKLVAERVAPWLKGKIVTEDLPSLNGNDVFEISTKDGKLIIKANSMPAAGMGLNYYLKHICKQHYGLASSNITHLKKLPKIKKPIRKESAFKYRHFANFCTQNYSASFWTWNEWESMIDFMVLNGVNLTIATVGLEKVWYNTLKQFNYTEKEIFDFLPGPAFNAWHMMANLEGWGGPINNRMVESRYELEVKILARLREYGIDPIYMSFYGMVPSTLKNKYPDSNIIDQGYWVGGFKRPDVLVPTDDLYKKMSDVYYKEVNELYGKFDFFAGEPFHEGGNKAGIDIPQMAVDVLEIMRTYNEGAIWVLQGWSGNPSKEFLSKLSKEDDVLIWDLRGELVAEWESSDGYGGYPYFWGVINNFGETPGLYGRLKRFNSELFRAKNGVFGENMQGLSVAPEGVLNNPVNFDLLYELAWNSDEIDIDKWVSNYAEFRYGKKDKHMDEVWKILLNTAYSSEFDSVLIATESNTLPSIVGNGESLLCAPPAMDIRTASVWGTSKLYYDYAKMKAISTHLLKSIDRFKDVDAFQYDLVDFTRQLLSNEFRAVYGKMNQAIKDKKIEEVDTYSEILLDLLIDLDDIQSTKSEFMLGTWINAAKRQAVNSSEEALYEFNARAIVTYWGKDDPKTHLRDYAHKEWSGLVKDVHYPRWKAFIDNQKRILEGRPIVPFDNTAFEIEWAKKRNIYPDIPQKDFATTAKRILNKFNKNYSKK